MLLTHVLETDVLFLLQDKQYELHAHKHTWNICKTLPYSSTALRSEDVSPNNIVMFTMHRKALQQHKKALRKNYIHVWPLEKPPCFTEDIRDQEKQLTWAAEPWFWAKGGLTVPNLQLPEGFFFLGILPLSVWSQWVSQRHNSLISARATLIFRENGLFLCFALVTNKKKKTLHYFLCSFPINTLLLSTVLIPHWQGEKPDAPAVEKKTHWISSLADKPLLA